MLISDSLEGKLSGRLQAFLAIEPSIIAGENMNNPCYLWWDLKIPEERRTVTIICENCHKNNPQAHKGMFWGGNYGQYDYICHFCNFEIYKAERKLNDENTANI